MFVEIPPTRARSSRDVVALAYDGLCTFEFRIVVEVFGLPRPELGDAWYRFGVCLQERGPLRATGGVQIRAARGLAALRGADAVIVPGWRDPDERPPRSSCTRSASPIAGAPEC